MRDHVVLCGPDVDGDYSDEETLRAGGVADAEAVAVLEEDGVGNVHAALGARRGRACSCWHRVKASRRSVPAVDRVAPCWGSRTASAPACSTWTAS